MTAAVPPLAPAPPAGRDRPGRVRDIIDRWQHGEPPDAAAALTADPDLAADRPLALELAYEEYCLRAETARPVDADSFCRRFPFRTSLMRLIAVHSFIGRHADALGPTRPTRRFAAGDVLGDFRVRRPLGQGGFSDVYLAEELTAGCRPVVVKVTVTVTDEGEADASGPLSHPHLMPVYSSPRVGEYRLVVMPFYGTATLEDVLAVAGGRTAAGVLDAARAGSRPDDPPFTSTPPFGVRPTDRRSGAVGAIAAAVADALAHLHARGLAHRDIKPSNVLLGAGGHPYLHDFNLSSGPLAPARLGGTVPYMPPEVIAAVRRGDAAGVEWRAADVYSFGVLVWEQLAGVHPFLADGELLATADRETVLALMADRQRADRRNHTAHLRQVSRRVRRMLDRCLSPDPTARPPAAELRAAFTPPRRRRWVWPAIVGALLVVTAGVGVAWATRTPLPAEPDLTDPVVRGDHFRGRGQFDLAATAFLEAADTRRDGRAYACAAYCYLRRGGHERAADLGRRAADHGYNDAPVWANLAYTLLVQNDYARSIGYADKALDHDPNCRPALLTRAMAHLRLRETSNISLPRSAGDDLRAALNLPGPSNMMLWVGATRLLALLPDPTPADLDLAAETALTARRAGTPARELSFIGEKNPGLRDRANFRLAVGDAGVGTVPADDENPHLMYPAGK